MIISFIYKNYYFNCNRRHGIKASEDGRVRGADHQLDKDFRFNNNSMNRITMCARTEPDDFCLSAAMEYLRKSKKFLTILWMQKQWISLFWGSCSADYKPSYCSDTQKYTWQQLPEITLDIFWWQFTISRWFPRLQRKKNNIRQLQRAKLEEEIVQNISLPTTLALKCFMILKIRASMVSKIPRTSWKPDHTISLIPEHHWHDTIILQKLFDGVIGWLFNWLVDWMIGFTMPASSTLWNIQINKGNPAIINKPPPPRPTF